MRVGVEIGGTKIQAAVGDAEGRILERRRYQVDVRAGAKGIRDQIGEAARRFARAYGTPSGVGAGFGGPIDWRAGRVERSHHVPGWSGFELGPWLEDVFGCRAVCDNDANVAALAEAARGAGAGLSPVFYATLGSGVGGGLVRDGAIYHGASPGEAEIGHLRLNREGAILEERCSGWALDARIRKAVAAGDTGALAARAAADPGAEARHLPSAVAANDPTALRIIDELAEDLAFALSHVSHLFHPETIVLGGGVALLGEILRRPTAEKLSRAVMEAHRPGPDLRVAALGEDAVPVGALLLSSQGG